MRDRRRVVACRGDDGRHRSPVLDGDVPGSTSRRSVSCDESGSPDGGLYFARVGMATAADDGGRENYSKVVLSKRMVVSVERYIGTYYV